MLTQEFRATKRGKAFTEQEKLLLYQCMLPDLDILDSKAMDSISVVRKTEAWRRVTLKFNSDPNVSQRTTEQLKKCFENAKCRKQWVVPPDSATGIVEPVVSLKGPTVVPRSGNKTSFSRLFQNKGNGSVILSENAIADFGRYNDDIHCNLEQRLDSIKCELVDIADGPDDVEEDTEDVSTVVETHVEPVLSEYVVESGHSEYAGQVNLLEQRLTSNSEDTGDDLEEVTGSIFLEQSIYHAAEAQRYNPRKRVRRHVDSIQIDGDTLHNDHATKTSRSSQIQAMEDRLLKAQVREAEAAASAAEVQLQLNEMALQHAQAEETRRKQLHALRVRRLTNLLRDQSAEDC